MSEETQDRRLRRRVPPQAEPAWAWELREAVRDIERAQIALTAKMDYLIKEAEDQKEFRRWALRLGVAAIALLVLDALGFDISVIK